jgi:hypothetical protein
MYGNPSMLGAWLARSRSGGERFLACAARAVDRILGRVSYWSGLWVGDAEHIGAALDGEAGDEVALAQADHVLAHVDLPGIVPDAGDTPGSPERLTAIACEVTGESARSDLTFAGARGRQLAGDADPREGSRGAFEMAPAWVRLFAGLDDVEVQRIGQRWAGEWAAEADVPVASVTDIIDLVVQVRDACRIATERRAAVVYSWML